MRDSAVPAAAIFVKTPGHSPVKTRLAACIGTEAAERLHLACAQAVAAVLRQCAPPVAGYFAVAEPAAHALWPGLPVVAQGAGGLGTRLHQVYATLQARHGQVLLLGADAPQLDAALLAHALGWLQRPGPRIAMGPARDGGFWLFGGNRPVPRSAWEGTSYSRSDTGAQLLAAVQGLAGVLQVPPLQDLDSAGDIAAVRAALAALPQALPEQRLVGSLLDQLARSGLAEPHG